MRLTALLLICLVIGVQETYAGADTDKNLKATSTIMSTTSATTAKPPLATQTTATTTKPPSTTQHQGNATQNAAPVGNGTSKKGSSFGSLIGSALTFLSKTNDTTTVPPYLSEQNAAENARQEYIDTAIQDALHNRTTSEQMPPEADPKQNVPPNVAPNVTPNATQNATQDSPHLTHGIPDHEDKALHEAINNALHNGHANDPSNHGEAIGGSVTPNATQNATQDSPHLTHGIPDHEDKAMHEAINNALHNGHANDPSSNHGEGIGSPVPYSSGIVKAAQPSSNPLSGITSMLGPLMNVLGISGGGGAKPSGGKPADGKPGGMMSIIQNIIGLFTGKGQSKDGKGGGGGNPVLAFISSSLSKLFTDRMKASAKNPNPPRNIFDMIFGIFGYSRDHTKEEAERVTTIRPDYYRIPLTSVLSESLAQQVRDLIEQTMKVFRAGFKLAVDVYRANMMPYVSSLLGPFIREDVVPALREFVAPMMSVSIEPMVSSLMKSIMVGSDDGQSKGLISLILGSLLG